MVSELWSPNWWAASEDALVNIVSWFTNGLQYQNIHPRKSQFSDQMWITQITHRSKKNCMNVKLFCTFQKVIVVPEIRSNDKWPQLPTVAITYCSMQLLPYKNNSMPFGPCFTCTYLLHMLSSIPTAAAISLVVIPSWNSFFNKESSIHKGLLWEKFDIHGTCCGDQEGNNLSVQRWVLHTWLLGWRLKGTTPWVMKKIVPQEIKHCEHI